MKKRIFCGTFFITFLAICFVLVGKEGLLISNASTITKIFLSLSGSDSNIGSSSSPLKSINAAMSKASQATTSEVEIIFKAGTYEVSETIDFTKMDSVNSKKLKITNNGNDKVVISGCKTIAPSKFNKNGNIYSTSITGFNMNKKIYNGSIFKRKI